MSFVDIPVREMNLRSVGYAGLELIKSGSFYNWKSGSYSALFNVFIKLLVIVLFIIFIIYIVFLLLCY